MLLDLWREHACATVEPECCLVNVYRANARLGLHVDLDEQALDVPVLSVSIGAPAVLRVGGSRRNGPTETAIVRSGDVLVFAGADRLAYHGIDRVLVSPSEPVRINFTLRRVTRT
jgi:alkylated DNA repair protein (DNA oxidative demethylase)